MPIARLQAVLYELLRNIADIEQHNTADHGVTVAQSYTLLAIPPEEPISMSDLSDRLSLAKSTMTRMADQLVKRGLIQREHGELDRRAVYVRLTPDGQVLRAQIEADYTQFFTMVLAEVPNAETALHGLEQITAAVVAVMQKKHGRDNPA